MKMKVRTNHGLYRNTLSVPLLPGDSQSLSLVSFSDFKKGKNDENHHAASALKSLLQEMS